MPRLDQVRFHVPSGELVTLTVAVTRPGVRSGGPERRLAEEIAGYIWMTLEAEEEKTTTPE